MSFNLETLAKRFEVEGSAGEARAGTDIYNTGSRQLTQSQQRGAAGQSEQSGLYQEGGLKEDQEFETEAEKRSCSDGPV